MAFTRFHDDEARITKQLQQQTDQSRWYVDVPGNGDKPCFALDPYIIPQKWGGNLWTHSIDIQSSFLGIDRQLNRDCVQQEKYKRQTVHASPIEYPVCDTFLTTEQSRATMPAWTARDLTQNHAYLLQHNPQNHAEIPFRTDTSTRILEKDGFQRQFHWIPDTNQTYTLPTDIYNSQYKGHNATGTTLCDTNCSKI